METAFAAPAFYLSLYRFTLLLHDRLILPSHKGSTLRGGFGNAFKAIICPHPQRCRPRCRQGNNCPFGYVFQTAPPSEARVLRALDQVPRPFVIEPPWDQRTVYEPDETLTFQLILVGEACRYLTYFILAFQELGERGLGGQESRFKLASVEALQPLAGETALLFDAAQPAQICRDALPIRWDDIETYAARLPAHRLTLNFLTTTRLLEDRAPAAAPRFQLLVDYLLTRVSSLSAFFCGALLEVDFPGLKERAAGVELTRNESAWQDWSRHSRHQQQDIKMGGFVGRATYAGALAEFLPLLALGELIHVGKGVVFGNGMYRLTAF